MSMIVKNFRLRSYEAPAADVCEALTDVIICDSSDLSISYWEDDDTPIEF